MTRVVQGYSNPPKTDRRFFQTQLNELVKQRVVEKVKVPVAHAKNKIVCIRLRSPDAEEPPEDFGSLFLETMPLILLTYDLRVQRAKKRFQR